MSGQCEATVQKAKSPKFGQRCSRSAVNGATVCAAHGGVQQTTTPDAVRQRIDRFRQSCTARRRDGEPCEKWAIQGGYVCASHGGNLDNVKDAAKKRLLSLLPDAIATIGEIMNDPNKADSDRLRAAAMVTAKNGFGDKADLTVEIKPWEGLVESAGILRELDDIADAEVVEDDDPFGFDRLLDPLPDDKPPAKEASPEQEAVTSRAQPPSYVRR